MDRLDEFKDAGIKRVQVLGPGKGNSCCAACSVLVDAKFSIDNAPVLPPVSGGVKRV
jgi:hypothetical protein